jgi:hypothetical protein
MYSKKYGELRNRLVIAGDAMAFGGDGLCLDLEILEE